VPEPWTYFFRVSSLAYPTCLGKKDYVVVVVVVVIIRLIQKVQCKYVKI